MPPIKKHKLPTLSERVEGLNEEREQSNDEPSSSNLSPNIVDKPWTWGRTRPLNSHTPYEWPENRGYVNELRGKVQQCITYQSAIHVDQLVTGTNPLVRRTRADADLLAPQLHALDRNIMFKVMSSDPTPKSLVIYIPAALKRVWESQSQSNSQVSWDNMSVQVQNALASLAEIYPPDSVKGDARHKEDDNKQPTEPQHDVYGVYHFAVWKGTGHRYDPAGLNLKNHATSEKLTASTLFLRRIAPLIQAIGITFEAVDKSSYTSYLKLFDSHAPTSNLEILQTSKRACFMCIAVLRNVRVRPHKDKGDFRDGWAVMTCFGEWEEGSLCLPDLAVQGIESPNGGIRIAYQPGDVIFLRASVLEHFVSSFTGERSVFIFFTKNTL